MLGTQPSSSESRLVALCAAVWRCEHTPREARLNDHRVRYQVAAAYLLTGIQKSITILEYDPQRTNYP